MLKFNTFNVTNKTNGAKARVHYSLDNRIDGRKCVTIYAKDYSRELQSVFADIGGEYKNDTDSQTDYFEQGRVVIFEGDKLYSLARAAVEQIIASEQAKWLAKDAARIARRAR